VQRKCEKLSTTRGVDSSVQYGQSIPLYSLRRTHTTARSVARCAGTVTNSLEAPSYSPSIRKLTVENNTRYYDHLFSTHTVVISCQSRSQKLCNECGMSVLVESSKALSCTCIKYELDLDGSLVFGWAYWLKFVLSSHVSDVKLSKHKPVLATMRSKRLPGNPVGKR
jgi:hypothetical protein